MWIDLVSIRRGFGYLTRLLFFIQENKESVLAETQELDSPQNVNVELNTPRDINTSTSNPITCPISQQENRKVFEEEKSINNFEQTQCIEYRTVESKSFFVGGNTNGSGQQNVGPVVCNGVYTPHEYNFFLNGPPPYATNVDFTPRSRVLETIVERVTGDLRQIRSYSLIRELTSDKSDWEIKVRVSRLWDVERRKGKGTVIYTNMVLIDEESEYVHAILPGVKGSRLRQKIVEGEVNIIKNFRVLPNKEQYRVVSNNKIMLNFQFDTLFEAINDNGKIIPNHRFDFVTFHQLNQRRDNFSVLSDIFGKIVHEVREDTRIKILIEDQRGKRVTVKLWGRCCTDYIALKRQLDNEDKIKIVTITSILARDYKGFLSLSTSSSSKVYINLDIDEVNGLMTILRDKSGDNTMRCEEARFIDIVCQRKDIQAIKNHCTEEYQQDSRVDCLARVTRINANQPWFYSSCLDCNFKLRHRANDFWCYTCLKPIQKQIIRYRIELYVEDSTGSTIFTVLDREATKIIGQDAIGLYDIHMSKVDGDDENASPIPRFIHNIFVGKTYLFTLKISKYNHDPKNRQTFSLMNIVDDSIIEMDEYSTTNEGPTTKKKRLRSEFHQGDSEQCETGRSTKKKKRSISPKMKSRRSNEELMEATSFYYMFRSTTNEVSVL